MKSLVAALCTYSRIPLPKVELEKKDMDYVLVFFPLVGVIIGFFQALLCLVLRKFNVNNIIFAISSIVINMWITGGIHLDGYIDCMDAMNSYKSKEEKLGILKDPHVGAFAVIKFAEYILVSIIALYFISYGKSGSFFYLSITYTLSRVLSGLCANCLKKAKKDGMLNLVVNDKKKKLVTFLLIFEAVACFVYIFLLCSLKALLVTVTVSLLLIIIYRHKSYKEFGGVTGDSAGLFLCMSELVFFIVNSVIFIM